VIMISLPVGLRYYLNTARRCYCK